MRKRIGGISVQKIGAIVVGLAAAAIALMAFSGMFDTATTEFMSGIEWPEM